MKAKTIEKVVKGKKSYTMAEIREAIAYWKGRLASLNESDGGEGNAESDVVDDVPDKGGSIGLPNEDKVEDKAKASPVGAFIFVVLRPKYITSPLKSFILTISPSAN